MAREATEMFGANGKRGSHIERSFALALLIFLATFAMQARADELHLLINGKAIHLDEQPNTHYNERNWGGGFQYDWGTARDPWIPFASASGFNDSNRNMSYYAGGGILRRYYFDFGATEYRADIGLIGFAMTRKGFKGGDPFLGALPVFSIGTDKVALNMTYIPRVDPKMVPILFLQLKIKLVNF
jgi:Antimicrobial peptide resistance and lipid A acylation protein PagP